jgi:predicted nucleotidyltransferase
MQLPLAINLRRAQIREIVLAHHASNARILDATTFAQYAENVSFSILIYPSSETTLFDIGAIRYELRKLLGVVVEVLTPKSLPEVIREVVINKALPI